MTTYNLGIGGAADSALECGPSAVRCYGLDIGHHMHPQGALFDYNVCQLLNRLMQRYGKTAQDLAVGDVIYIPLPTYSVLESLRVHVDSKTNGFSFDVSDSFDRDLLGHHVRTTYTQAASPAAACTQAVTVVGIDSPQGLGADTRDRWDFTRDIEPLFYDVPGGLHLTITALPTVGTIEDFAIRLFVGIRRDGICHGDRVCETQTQDGALVNGQGDAN